LLSSTDNLELILAPAPGGFQYASQTARRCPGYVIDNIKTSEIPLQNLLLTFRQALRRDTSEGPAWSFRYQGRA
jgi:hypothetical protein